MLLKLHLKVETQSQCVRNAAPSRRRKYTDTAVRMSRVSVSAQCRPTVVWRRQKGDVLCI